MTPVATPSIHVLVSNTILLQKELNLLVEMADSMPRAKNTQDELGISCSTRELRSIKHTQTHTHTHTMVGICQTYKQKSQLKQLPKLEQFRQ